MWIIGGNKLHTGFIFLAYVDIHILCIDVELFCSELMTYTAFPCI